MIKKIWTRKGLDERTTDTDNIFESILNRISKERSRPSGLGRFFCVCTLLSYKFSCGLNVTIGAASTDSSRDAFILFQQGTIMASAVVVLHIPLLLFVVLPLLG